MKRRFCFSLTLLLISVTPLAHGSDYGMLAANEVSEASYYDFMDNDLFTHIGDNRGPSGPDLIPCRDNIYNLLQSWGLSVQLEPFTHNSNTYHNVVATQWGTVYPDQEFIIGAHYDSVSNPGADDNASGVALVLECARILSQYDSEYTIRYVAFSMEEVGLVGSEAYVADHFADNILGMISADMVAYDPNTNNCNIYGRSASSSIKNALAAAVAEYGDGLTYNIGGDTPYSDHAPFEAAGYQACLLIEGQVWNNPWYHTQDDNFEKPGNLNFQYAVKMTRSIVGWLVDQAQVQVDADYLELSYPDGLPAYAAPNGSTTAAVDVLSVGGLTPDPNAALLHFDDGTGWQSVPMAALDADTFEATFPALSCGTELSYYFTVTDTLGEVFTDPKDAPVEAYSAMSAYGYGAFYEEPLDTDPGWTTEGQWAFGQPQGQGGAHGMPDPFAGYSGPNVYGYNLSGDYEQLLPPTHLTSTPIDCTGRFDVSLSFWRWLGVESPYYDHAIVYVSNDGTGWTQVWRNTVEIEGGLWVHQVFDISDIADDQSTVYLRWTMGPTDGSWQYCGWNIDDIQLDAVVCTAPAVLGDMNCDGLVDFEDINPFVLGLTAPDSYDQQFPQCDRLRGDLTDDGVFDFDDINPFVAMLTG